MGVTHRAESSKERQSGVACLLYKEKRHIRSNFIFNKISSFQDGNTSIVVFLILMPYGRVGWSERFGENSASIFRVEDRILALKMRWYIPPKPQYSPTGPQHIPTKISSPFLTVFSLEDGGNIFLRNIDTQLQVRIVS